MITHLNYNHLRYFHAIVKEGSLTKAAQKLHVAQSALSIQLKKLEDSLGSPLFERQHKSLILTEEGRIAFDYAETIFRAGDEMVATLQNQHTLYRNTLKVGAVSTLSKNFQIGFLKEAFDDKNVEVTIHSSTLSELLKLLKTHRLDLILSNDPVQRESDLTVHSHLLSEQSISLVAPVSLSLPSPFQFPEDLEDCPLILPSPESSVRTFFDQKVKQAGITPLIAAETNDMAMLRVIAKDTAAVSLVPRVVVEEELNRKELVELCQIPNIRETFYAITATRRYPNPYISKLLS